MSDDQLREPSTDEQIARELQQIRKNLQQMNDHFGALVSGVRSQTDR